MADVIASMWLMLLPLFVLYLADLIANVADVIATQGNNISHNDNIQQKVGITSIHTTNGNNICH